VATGAGRDEFVLLLLLSGVRTSCTARALVLILTVGADGSTGAAFFVVEPAVPQSDVPELLSVFCPNHSHRKTLITIIIYDNFTVKAYK
jgi:hypothetical protein